MKGALICPDTSVVVAGLSSWHEHHAIALPVLIGRPAAIQHVLAEAYAVLTRLPGGTGVSPSIAFGALQGAFGRDRLSLSVDEMFHLLERLARSGIGGRGTYDAIVAETARLAGARLLTLDRRASRTYEVVGVHYELLEG